MIRSSPDDWRLQASFLTAIPSFSSTTGDSLRLPLYKSPRFVNRLKDRKSTRLNSSHVEISYAVFCLKKKISRDAFGAEQSFLLSTNPHNDQSALPLPGSSVETGGDVEDNRPARTVVHPPV